MSCINDAIAINVSSSFAWLNKGAILNELNQYTEAENCYEKALAINKNFHEATWNLSLIKLKQKKIEIGFEYFEARWLRENADPYWHKHLKVLKKNSYINKKNMRYIGFGGNGHQVRDILHINDLCEIILEQIKKFKKINNTIFNVSGGKKNAISLQEISSYLDSIFSSRIKFKKKRRHQFMIFRIILVQIKKSLNYTNGNQKEILKL